MSVDKKHWVYILTHLPTGLFLVGTSANPGVQFGSIKANLAKGTYSDLRLQQAYKAPEELEFGVTFEGTEKQVDVEKDNILLSCKEDPKCLNNAQDFKSGSLPASHPLFSQHMRKFDGTSCVYVLKNLTNGYFYIGSTQCIYDRTKTHLRELREGKHHCVKLQEDYSGLSSIEFGIFPAGTVAQARRLEQLMLDKFHGTKKCLNSSNSAYSNFKEVPPEWKHRYRSGRMLKDGPEGRPKPRFKSSKPSRPTPPTKTSAMMNLDNKHLDATRRYGG